MFRDEKGYSLTETLLVMLLMAWLASRGVHQWRGYRLALQLEQAGQQLRDFLLRQQLRANLENRAIRLWGADDGNGCIGADNAAPRCVPGVYRYLPPFDDIQLSYQLSSDAGFYGVRNSAMAGHVRLSNAAGGIRVIWSAQGRVRLCAEGERLLSLAVC